MARTLTAQNYIDRILEELDEADNAKLTYFLTDYWDQADDATVTERQYLRAKIKAIDFLLGRLRKEIDTQDEAGMVKLSQQTTHLRQIKADVQAELSGGSGGITTVRPSRGTFAT